MCWLSANGKPKVIIQKEFACGFEKQTAYRHSRMNQHSVDTTSTSKDTW
jgi:hypothetical protein